MSRPRVIVSISVSMALAGKKQLKCSLGVAVTQIISVALVLESMVSVPRPVCHTYNLLEFLKHIKYFGLKLLKPTPGPWGKPSPVSSSLLLCLVPS